MDNTNLKQLLTDYEKKRMNAVYEADLRKKEIYETAPRLAEIDSLISKYAIETTKLMLVSNDISLLEDLQNKIDLLKQEKVQILHSIHKTLEDLKPIYTCSICQDTGYTPENKMCNCLKQKLFNLEYNKSNIANLKNQTFELFQSSYYSDTANTEKYHSSLSPRENSEVLKKMAFHFIEHFDDPEEKNLLFSGSTGLGKSFLSGCIANELLKKGKTVLYQTAPVMLDTIIDYRFGKANVPKNIYDTILTVDLLIIDDLGTESMNSMKFTELFNIINTRLLNSNQKVLKTIISTNLSLQNLFSTYDERIVSRIVGNYHICYFYGDDIRFLKRK